MQAANLALRFLLELVALAVVSYWGWQLGEGLLRYLLVIAFPLLLAIVWGVFRVPNDPSPAPVAVPGIVRLGIEFVFFTLAVIAFAQTGHQLLALGFAVIVIIHYAIAWERLRWLVRQPE